MRGRHILLLAALSLCVSCLKDVEQSSSPEASINSLTLGYFNVYVHDISDSGGDTIVTERDNGGFYPMTIDQVNNKIYNVDSIPYGADLSRVLTIVSATGTVVYSYADDPEIGWLWRSYDSIDFSRKVIMSVISDDGEFLRSYDVQVNKHKVFPDSMVWDKRDFPTPLTDISTHIKNDTLYVFGTDNQGQDVLISGDLKGGSWNESSLSGLPAAWQHRTTVCDGIFYTVAEGVLYSSSDAINWTSVKNNILHVIQSDSDNGMLWAVTTDSMIVKSDDMTVWDTIQHVPEGFPDSASVVLSYPLLTNPSLTRHVMVGRSGDSEYATVWTLIDGDSGWTQVDAPADTNLRLPVTESLSVVNYDNSLFATGKGIGFHQSMDNGITWPYCERWAGLYASWNIYMQLPDDLKDSDSEFVCVADDYGYLWIISEEGLAWRGAITRLKKR